MIADATEAFRNYDVDKVMKQRANLLSTSNITEEQLSIMRKVAKLPKSEKISAEDKAMLPEVFRTKKACSEFVDKYRTTIYAAIDQ